MTNPKRPVQFERNPFALDGKLSYRQRHIGRAGTTALNQLIWHNRCKEVVQSRIFTVRFTGRPHVHLLGRVY